MHKWTISPVIEVTCTDPRRIFFLLFDGFCFRLKTRFWTLETGNSNFSKIITDIELKISGLLEFKKGLPSIKILDLSKILKLSKDLIRNL